MNLDELDYDLPADRIAQYPPRDRLDAKLLVLHRQSARIEHAGVRDLAQWLRPGDRLVLNDTRVLPARIRLRRSTGGIIDGLFLREQGLGRWEALLRNASKLKPGEKLRFPNPGWTVTHVESLGRGMHVVEIAPADPAEVVLDRVGRTPLPPYIRREFADDPVADGPDRERYQTEYARTPGAVAAPTAGMHFTKPFLDNLVAAGIDTSYLTLTVGLGTFQPITVANIEDHPMHAESYVLNEACAAAVAQTRRNGGRIIAVGTTATRALESAADQAGNLTPGQTETSLFIYPPHTFRIVDALITNFHLPRSTLLAMVFALASRELILKAYRTAVEHNYRFYSYGDAMLIL